MDIYAQRYLNDGSVLGNVFRLTDTSEGKQTEPDVKLWNGRIYNTWKENRIGNTWYDIWANILDWEKPVGARGDADNPKYLNYNLLQNYPNPFNPTTKIKFKIPQSIKVKIEVFNLLGQSIVTLLNKKMPAGSHEIEFNAKNLPSNVYLYRIQTNEFQQVKKMILIK